MTPEAARAVLLDGANWSRTKWLTTELYGGTRKAKQRHQEAQERELAANQVQAETLESVAALGDEDLQWLLDMGWDPMKTW